MSQSPVKKQQQQQQQKIETPQGKLVLNYVSMRNSYRSLGAIFHVIL